MLRKAKTTGIYPRILHRTGKTVFDAVVTVDNVQRTKRGFPNPTAAKAWQDEKRVDMRRGVDVRAPASMTVGELVWDRWLPVQQAECSTKRSRDTYGYWAQRIYADLGELPLRKLSKIDVTAWRTWLVTSSADATARGVFSCLVAAIRWAVAHDLMPRDVTLATKRPKAAPRNPPVQPIDVVQQLLDRAEVEEAPTGLMVWLGTVLGLRFGEVVSLQWEQIDFADKRIRLNRIVQRQVDGTIKTDAGERTIGLTSDQVEKLRDYRQEQMRVYREKEASPPRLVVLRANGVPVTASWFWWRFNAVRETLGLPWLHFHDLRHVNATMLARAGVHPKVAQERLGHANPATTMRIYTHVSAEQQSEAADALETLMRKGNP
jgi:integrase